MDTEPEDERSAGHPTLASSWDAACGALGRSLRVRGAQDSDWEELLAPPASGQDLVSLKRSPKSPDGKPCFLSLSCAPSGGEEIVSVGILSSARNMEVYLGEEYCGTSRGGSVGNVLDSSEQEKIILYKNFLKLEPAAHACKIKLLSFGEKPCVFVSQVVVHVRPSLAKPPASFAAPGPRVDLERVHSLLAAMGSTLSPGAQQLMSMVRFQQQRGIPLGEQLQAVLGSAACQRVLGLRASAPSGAWDRPPCAPAPLRAWPMAGRGTEDANAPGEESARPPAGGPPAALGGRDTAPQSLPLPGGELDLQPAASVLPKKASAGPGAPGPQLLPILQDVCGQVRHLRGAQDTTWPGHVPTPSAGGLAAGMGEQPACSYLERILSKKLELMERRLMDHLEERLRALQEHLDRQVALLARSLHSPGSPPLSPPPGVQLPHCDSRDTLSNGER
ncbi:ATPase PAAT isoform X1 [Pipistrellus kuhlii]|uniref:Protein associated with ABC transporters n=3 Tax=Pipistrellus kuhlii TaxID=59472 RepID=A0A7J7VAB5_PIPKU|nr:ATPase PAAT isoform X1 [Pipistrellus kuhlii]KAF6322089.1 protein associated with ABC transporters [Pipistrellus kuhlii]